MKMAVVSLDSVYERATTWRWSLADRVGRRKSDGTR